MELSIGEKNGRKVYNVTDNRGLTREVTIEFVKFAIESGELNNCYINSTGDIVIRAKSGALEQPNTNYTHRLLGKLLDTDYNLIGYLVQQINNSKVSKATIDVFTALVKRGVVEGAIMKDDNELFITFGVDEYQLVKDNGKLIPHKIVRNKVSKNTITMSIEVSFDEAQDMAINLDKDLVRGTNPNDRLGGSRKYPDISDMRSDGIVAQIDTIKMPIQLLNRKDILDDIAGYADLIFEYKKEVVNLKIMNIDYRLNAFTLVAGVYLAYKKLCNNFAKLTDVIISGDGKYYWSATFSENKLEIKKDTIVRKTKSDINIIQEMYILEKTQLTADMDKVTEQSFVKGLKLGTCNIVINCIGCNYTSTEYRVDPIEKEVYIKFKMNGGMDLIEEIAYKGKNVDSLNPGMICIIAATAVAEQHVITSVSVIDLRSNLTYDFIFKPRSESIGISNLMKALE